MRETVVKTIQIKYIIYNISYIFFMSAEIFYLCLFF